MHNLYCGVVVDKVQSLGDSAIGNLLNASKFSPDWLEPCARGQEKSAAQQGVSANMSLLEY
tara:strand:- start:437 stop:619 length:183 start_codon:yes stop_codon:yes gene_type:complete